jgi:C4-dicarboxylate-specific signal transduction histidine kinase
MFRIGCDDLAGRTDILANVETLQSMLKSPAPDMEETREITADIRRDDVRASEVIHRLRSLLKKAPFEEKSLDLSEIVRGSVALLSSQVAARQVDVSTAIGPPSLPISGDRIQLQQVILNLIFNAIDAMSSIPASDRRLAIWTSLRAASRWVWGHFEELRPYFASR